MRIPLHSIYRRQTAAHSPCPFIARIFRCINTVATVVRHSPPDREKPRYHRKKTPFQWFSDIGCDVIAFHSVSSTRWFIDLNLELCKKCVMIAREWNLFHCGVIVVRELLLIAYNTLNGPSSPIQNQMSYRYTLRFALSPNHAVISILIVVPSALSHRCSTQWAKSSMDNMS